MLINIILLLVICSVQISLQSEEKFPEKYEFTENSLHQPMRLLHLMINYHQSAKQRVYELRTQRFMYEESPHYEMGYVMAEIIERYRKLVNHVDRLLKFFTDTVMDAIKATEQVQLLYFEVNHLVNMMHEIYRKYRHNVEFAVLEVQPAEAAKQQAVIEQKISAPAISERDIRREKKKRQKLLKQIRYIQESQKRLGVSESRVYNKWWPRDYGWEIDYKWW